MADERDDERTEPATPRRREEARKRGQVARSADLSSAVILLAAVLALRFLGRSMMGGLFASAATVLENLASVNGDPAGLVGEFGGAFVAAALGFLPFAAVVVAASLAANLFQVGFLFTTEPLTPDLDRINPITGLGRLFSLRGLARVVAGLLKASLVAAVVFWTLWAERVRLVELSGIGFEQIVGVAVELTLTVSLRAALALLGLAILEYGVQRWQFERDLRMSRREVREELKRYEGDPAIKQRRRAIQQQLALQRMLGGVPDATVVIADPEGVAVAVRYEKSMDAPVVVAKGAELLARRIREAALEHGVPVVERAELARALYKRVDVGGTVPPELYQASAEILAYVYRIKGLAAAS